MTIPAKQTPSAERREEVRQLWSEHGAGTFFIEAVHGQRFWDFIAALDVLAESRAEVEAMRNPTDPMLDAAHDWSLAKYGKPIGNDAEIGCWRAMFDALPIKGDAP